MKNVMAFLLAMAFLLGACGAEPAETIDAETAVFIALDEAEDHVPAALTAGMARCELDSDWIYHVTFRPDPLKTLEATVLVDALDGTILEVHVTH